MVHYERHILHRRIDCDFPKIQRIISLQSSALIYFHKMVQYIYIRGSLTILLDIFWKLFENSDIGFRQNIMIRILFMHIALLFSSYALAMTVENQRKLYKFLEEDMCPYIKPMEDQERPIVVNIDIGLFSLLSYDDTTGTLNSLVVIHLEWKDEFIANGNFSFKESDAILIPLHFCGIRKSFSSTPKQKIWYCRLVSPILKLRYLTKTAFWNSPK